MTSYKSMLGSDYFENHIYMVINYSVEYFLTSGRITLTFV